LNHGFERSFCWARGRYLSKSARGFWTVAVWFGRSLVSQNQGFVNIPVHASFWLNIAWWQSVRRKDARVEQSATCVAG
jgi:hypothetical protein